MAVAEVAGAKFPASAFDGNVFYPNRKKAREIFFYQNSARACVYNSLGSKVIHEFVHMFSGIGRQEPRSNLRYLGKTAAMFDEVNSNKIFSETIAWLAPIRENQPNDVPSIPRSIYWDVVHSSHFAPMTPYLIEMFCEYAKFKKA